MVRPSVERESERVSVRGSDHEQIMTALPCSPSHLIFAALTDQVLSWLDECDGVEVILYFHAFGMIVLFE